MENKLYSALDICNVALAKAGQRPIRGITPHGNIYQMLAYQSYHPVRRQTLVSKPWDFATKTEEISAPEGSRKHRIPYDCLRVQDVSDPAWSMEGRDIICLEPTITLTYTTDEEDVEKFSDEFVEEFTDALAKKFKLW